jgi:hypothetical protein
VETGVTDMLLLTRILMGCTIQDQISLALAGQPGVTDGLAYPVWDYSAYKSSIYLLREGQIHMPSVDTWTAGKRAAPPCPSQSPGWDTPCQADVVDGKNTW